MRSIAELCNRYRDRLILFAIFSFSLAGYSLEWHYESYGDVTTAAAQRVLAGQIPYRDFWTMYAPGSFYLLAFLFFVFGQHVLVGIVASSVLFAASGCLCYLLCSRLTAKPLPGVAVAAILFSAAFATGYYKSLGPYPPVVFFVVLSLYSILTFYRTHRSRYLFSAGIAIGAAVVFKHDVAAYTAFAILIGLAVQVQIEDRPGHAILTLLQRVGIYLCGLFLIAAPPMGYFLAVAGPDMIEDLFVFPGGDFRFARPENYPGLFPFGIYDDWHFKMLLNFFRYLSFAIPFFVLLGGVFSLGIVFTRNRKSVYLPMGVTFTMAFLCHYGSAHVQINTNIISMSMYAAFLCVLTYDTILKDLDFMPPVLIRTLAGSFMILWVLALVSKPGYSHFSRDGSKYSPMEFPQISGMKFHINNAKILTGLAEYIRNTVPPTETVFLGASRHDALLIGDSGIYFLIDRMNPTRHDQLHPGVVDRADKQKEIITDLESSGNQYIILKHILSSDDAERIKRNRIVHLPDSRSRILDTYIENHYTPIRTFGKYTVMKRHR